MLKNILFAVIVIASFSGCSKKSNNSCTYDPCAVKAPASEIQAVQNYLTTNGITAIQACSGLFYRIDTDGTGANPASCSNISVTYEGKLTNGTVFDSASTPISFNLSQVITGWRDGLPLVKAGGTIYLYIPPTLGYGSQQAGSIPPNSILIFKVNLVSVQ